MRKFDANNRFISNVAVLQLQQLLQLLLIASIGIANANAVLLQQEDTSRSRRHLLGGGDEGACVLYLKEIQFENNQETTETETTSTTTSTSTHKDTWACEFTKEQAKEFGGQRMMDIEGLPQELFDSNHVLSGEAILKVSSGAFLVEQRSNHEHSYSYAHTAMTMVVPDESLATIETLPNTDPRHQLQRRKQRAERNDKHAASAAANNNNANSNPAFARSMGTLQILVVRVIGSDNSQISASAGQLKDDIFTDSVSLKTQMAACSKDQLIIEPAGVGTSGIVDVQIDIPVDGANTPDVENAAFRKAENLYTADWDTFDLVMFCVPYGSSNGSKKNWVAYAYVNGYTSYYNDPWCQRVSTQMHEVGHNMNLGHSGKGSDPYGDKSTMMGYSYPIDDGPIICFNPTNNYQLGWYDLQKASINPLDYGPDPRTYVLNGVDDYKTDPSASNGELITLRLDNGGDNGGTDYYIGYNRAAGANRGTTEALNTVVVYSKAAGPYDYAAASTYRFDLEVGGGIIIADFRGTGVDVTVKVVSISSNLRNATIEISHTGTHPPTVPPTPAPTSFPPTQLVCEDDASFTYKNKPKKTCNKWVGKFKNKLNKRNKFKKTQRRCKRRYKGKRVWDYCPVLCAMVDLGPCFEG